MVGSETTKARTARLCKFGMFALFVPILMAGGCPFLTLTITDCPTEDVAVGANVPIGYMVEYMGDGTVVVAGAIAGDGEFGAGGIALDDVGPSPVSTRATAAGNVTVTLTASDGMGLTSTAECTYTAAGCADNSECDDGNPCNGVETCETGACVDGTAVACDAGFTCNPDDGTCDCDDDASCDDANPCNGTETCGADGECAAGTAVECDETDLCNPEVCNPDNGMCEVTPVECDEGFTCNDTDGSCDCDDDAACDDGAFCNGTETCGAEGDCVAGTSPCAEGVDCDEDNDMCVGGDCETDADCDDGTFCNGTETCVDNACVAGDDPCAATDCGGETPMCEEGDDAAVCSCPPLEGINFTLGQDNLTGSTGDDTFEAPLEFNAGNGAQVATLQTGDQANGLAGNDTLSATFNAAAAIVPTSLAGIEDINVTTFGNGDATDGNVTTLNASNISGVNNIFSVNSTDDLTITALQEHTNLGMTGISDANVDLTATFALIATTSGTTDAIDFTVGSTVGTVTINPAATNGFETLNVISSGASPNTVTQIDETGTTLATATFSGAQDLQVMTMDNTILTYDASGMSGGLTLGNGTTAATYATFATSDLNSITGGTGNDVIIFANTLTTADAAEITEFLDLGDGDDVLQATFAASFGTGLPLTNTEEVRFNATANAITVNFQTVTGLNTITIEADAAAHTMTLQGVPGTPGLHFRGAGTQAAQIFDTITYTGSMLSGTDTLNVSVDNRGTALNATGVTNTYTVGGGNLVGSGIEIINIDVADGPATFAGLNFANATTYTFTASSNLTLGTVAAATTTTQTSVSAAGVVGDFSATLAGLADFAVVTMGNGANNTLSLAGSGGTSISVTGGSGADTITGSAQADTLNGAGGNDVLIGANGIDNITTGTGSDTVSFVTIVAAANANNCLDFTAGTGGDIIRLDATTFADYSGGATVTIRTVAAVVDTAATPDNQVIVDTQANIDAMNNANGSNPIAIATDSGNVIFDANGDYTAGQVVIGSIPQAQVAGLVAANFAIVP